MTNMTNRKKAIATYRHLQRKQRMLDREADYLSRLDCQADIACYLKHLSETHQNPQVIARF